MLVAAEIERVAWTFEDQRVADVERIVHLDRTAAAVSDSAYRDAVVGAPPGRTAQRVLATTARRQLDVDVPARRPRRKQSAIRVGKRQCDHIRGDELAFSDDGGGRTPHRHNPRRFPSSARCDPAERSAQAPQCRVETISLTATVDVGWPAGPDRFRPQTLTSRARVRAGDS